MAQTIKIKRSTTTAVPSSLSAGELAYSDNSDKLFIGRPSDGAVVAIGGETYVNLFPATAGVLEASKLVQVDSNKKINEWLVDNITIDGNTISASGNLVLDPSSNLDIDAGTIDLSSQATQFSLIDNSATALTIAEAQTPICRLLRQTQVRRLQQARLLLLTETAQPVMAVLVLRTALLT